ncbi:hypothetical protein KKH39_05035 [Patescibacteria group bacterium]|nr:hypothetical protein [Patescibacteria group bacterium]
MRISILIILLAIIAFLFYQYISKGWWNDPILIPENVETPADNINYVNETTRKFGLENCLRLCIMSEQEDQSSCQASCNDEFSQ